MISYLSAQLFELGETMFHLQNITKTYNEKLILDKATLAVNSDEVIALIGENGVCNTTLLKILLGEVTHD